MQQGNLSNATPVGSGVHEYKIDFGPDIEFILRKMEKRSSFSLEEGRRNDNRGTLIRRLKDGKTTNNGRNKEKSEMPLTRDFKETVQARVRRDPAFRKELLREGVESFLCGDVETGKIVLRDYINATLDLRS